MLSVLNEYHPHNIGVTRLQLMAKHTPHYVAYIDTDMLDQISAQTWCMDSEKIQLYATVPTTSPVPTALRIASRRVFLWKYLLFLETGKIARFWHRNRHDDYRLPRGDRNNGYIVWTTVSEPPTNSRSLREQPPTNSRSLREQPANDAGRPAVGADNGTAAPTEGM